VNNETLLHPEFRSLLRKLILRMFELGYEVDLHQGYRSFDEQHKLYLKRPRVTHADAGESLHNYGLAGDMVFKVNGKWSWDEKHPWKLLGAEGKKLGLEWGGDFKKINDRPHFQYTKGFSLAKIKQLYKAGKLTKVWGAI
jgi:peptidoglycan LD-endopeptidase CwlK